MHAPLNATHKTRIREILKDGLQQDAANKAEELKSCKHLPEYACRKRRECIASKPAKHAKKHRKLGIEQVRDENGNAITNAGEASKYLGGYWGDKFAEKGIDENLADKFIGKYSLRRPG